MADLDDFFAKKDRKKKTTKKFTTTEEVAKKLEDTAKKTEKQKKERVPEGEENEVQPQEQDEWKDFEEEKKDYTGLKIGNLTLGANQESNSSNNEDGTGDQPETNKTGQDGDRKAGPWNRTQATEAPIEEEKPVPLEKPEATPAPEPAPSGPATYRPPSMRFKPTSSRNTNSSSRHQRGQPLDLKNDDFFPSLSRSNEGKKNKGEGVFEVVQQHKSSSSYRQHMEQTKGTGGPQLNLGNRYNSLSNDS